MTKNILRIAPPYTKEDIEQIRERFSNVLHHPVSFDLVEEDAALVGGFRAFIGGTVYDASLSGQFDALREGSHE